MNSDDLRHTIARSTDSDEMISAEAKQHLLQEDEAIIPALIDEFYAGVNLPTGTVLLDIIGQIGGYLAVNLFFELLEDKNTPINWREKTEYWLYHDGFL
ncbi:MAG TPA: hypothetical protein VHL11_13545 [Phototrophicaceae bacterium]|jgi:hypothetical protein|nr:hypothetical protein [Phototrophicaceae bacterium]